MEWTELVVESGVYTPILPTSCWCGGVGVGACLVITDVVLVDPHDEGGVLPAEALTVLDPSPTSKAKS